MSRLSSSFSSPSLCSFQTFIGLAVILCVYFTLQSSRSLTYKSIVSEHIKTILPSSVDRKPSLYKTYEVEPYSSHPEGETTFHDPPSDREIESETIQGGLAQDFEINWGEHRGKFHENGTLLTLSLDKDSGSGFQSKSEYLFAKIDIYIKLIPDNAAGTVTTFYMSSNKTKHDEIDFEFLGNVSGQPYTVHTNIYSQGKGKREQQFYLWFDPTEDFHKYSILWNPKRIIFYVDETPIREFKNVESYGVPFPKNQPMRIFSSLWNADDWATQGGRVHTDWSNAPFVASFKDFSASACVWSYGSSSCGPNPSFENPWIIEELDSKSLKKMRWVQENYMTYNYCNDENRFKKEGLPKECTIPKEEVLRRRRYK